MEVYMKILAVCGAGMGTSVMMKIKLSQFLQEHNADAEIESCALDEAQGNLSDADIVICSQHLAGELGNAPEHTKMLLVDNIMNISAYGADVLAALTGNS